MVLWFIFLQSVLASSVGQCTAQRVDEMFTLLTANRQEMLQILFPHFTPYVDMMDLVLRASEFGFPSFLRRANILSDSLAINIPEKYFISSKRRVELHIPTYVMNVILLAKYKSGRHNKQSIFGQNCQDIYYNSIRPIGLMRMVYSAGARYLLYQQELMMSEDSHLRQSINLANPINSYNFEYSKGRQKIPIALQAMAGWKGLFWMAVSEMPNFYSAVRGITGREHKTSIATPGRLDEMSATFIFHLCAALRKDVDILQTDIPEGFCPNPCSTLPCQTLPNTAGQQCYLIGLGLFINDFRCECLPGFEWFSNNVGSTEKREKDKLETPNSDDVGSCVEIDICSTYCSFKGSRRCDVIPGTGTAICNCKMNFMGPTCNTQRNPCIELSAKEKTPGNMACNSGQGGQCIPTMGSDFYKCRLQYENCLALKDKCIVEVCVRGDCISSPDGSKMTCQCPEEAYGPRCGSLRGSWAEWAPWSSCSPVCGHRQGRRRDRVRRCLSRSGTCGRDGQSHQVQICAQPLPCPDDLVFLGTGPQTVMSQGGEARANFKLQYIGTLLKRRICLLNQMLKFIFMMMAAFALSSATVMFMQALLY